MKANDPVTIGIAILIIIAAILFVRWTGAGTVVSTPVVNTVTNGISNAIGATSNQSAVGEGALFEKAPELRDIAGYINAPDNLTIASLKGDVVLVDFWTYSCINCIRTLPYLEAWEQKYGPMGFVIIGVQSPEFDFEKDFNNVQMAVTKYNLTYPVVLDNDHATWDAYQNLYWPEDYLVDTNGYIRYTHIGEGDYDTTESEIQQLLMERNQNASPGGIVASNITENYDLSQVGTPEIYLGYSFARQPIGNPQGFVQDQIVNYSIPQTTQANVVYFSGSWLNNPDNMELASDTGKIVLTYDAKNVNIVAGGNGTLSLLLDNAAPAADQYGLDTVNDTVTVNQQRLYSLIDDTGYNQRTLEIDVTGKGFMIYTFTFG
jgi:thiol-disulfide isomerase/thioredoxin